MKKTEPSRAGWYFLLIIIIIYTLIAFLKPEALLPSLNFFLGVIINVIPMFILIFTLMVIINRFVSPQKLVKHFGKKTGAKGWLIAVITGIISEGPLYLWYPLLSDLQKKGVRNSFIATFLYNRAIKLPLLPLMVYYFGLAYAIVLSLVMIVASIFQGLLVERIMEVKE
ncbi:hypothetical protein JXB28_03105 [Candidatus Woesearchaeota archaeon]|nr:hypothetical protein [Candidatus Woesearchaeota archaeon]